MSHGRAWLVTVGILVLLASLLLAAAPPGGHPPAVGAAAPVPVMGLGTRASTTLAGPVGSPATFERPFAPVPGPRVAVSPSPSGVAPALGAANPAVQVWFVVETTLYDGVYDYSAADAGSSTCTGPCNESNGVPYFVANAGQVASVLAALHPGLNLTFGLVDYFSTSNSAGTCQGSTFYGDHDDGDGCSFHVDVASPVAANQFQSSVTSTFQAVQLAGSYYVPDSDYSDNMLTSSSISSLYGLQTGNGVSWASAPYHVVAWMGSTAPRDTQYPIDYAASQSDYPSGIATMCEPQLFVGEPGCEGWLTTPSSVGQMAQRNGTLINVIDLAAGPTNASSGDYKAVPAAANDSAHILRAGCELAVGTGGIWEGPPGYACTAAFNASGQGNLTCNQGSSCFPATSYTSPPTSWASNPPLGYALTHLNFPTTSSAPNPLAAILVSTPAKVKLGTSVSLTTIARAGAPPYTYAYVTLPPGCVSLNASSLACTPSAVGNYTLAVNVSDTGRHHAIATTWLQVSNVAPLATTISATPLVGHAPLLVSFWSNATGGAPPYVRSWQFGNGATGVGQNTTYSYGAPGNFSVVLQVTDAVGNIVYGTLSIEVLPSPPPLTATMTATPTTGPIYLHVNFTVTASGGAAPYMYAWAFGDGGTSTLLAPAHTYTTVGTFYATVTVTDAVAATYTAYVYITTTPPPLTVAVLSSPNGTQAPANVSFNGTVSGGVAPYTFYWSFGDGSYSYVRNPWHVYMTGGNFTVTLVCYDYVGTAGQASLIQYVRPAPPLLPSAGAAPTVGTAPVAVAFTGGAAGGVPPYAYFWTFGDGSVATSSAPSHIYLTPGTFIATLAVSDQAGTVASANPITIAVGSASAGLHAAAAATPHSGVAPLNVSFAGVATGGSGTYSWSWTFGDGGAGSLLQSPYHIYTSPGTFRAVLQVTDGTGTQASASAWVNVSGSGAALSVAVSASPSVINIGGTTQLTATIAGGVAPYVLAWSSLPPGCNGGAGPSFVCKPTVAGTYTIKVTVTDGSGAVASQNAALLVNGPSPPPGGNGTTSSSGSTFLGLPLWALAVLALLVVAVLVAVVVVRRRRRAPPSGPGPVAAYTPSPMAPAGPSPTYFPPPPSPGPTVYPPPPPVAPAPPPPLATEEAPSSPGAGAEAGTEGGAGPSDESPLVEEPADGPSAP